MNLPVQSPTWSYYNDIQNLVSCTRKRATSTHACAKASSSLRFSSAGSWSGRGVSETRCFWGLSSPAQKTHPLFISSALPLATVSSPVGRTAAYRARFRSQQSRHRSGEQRHIERASARNSLVTGRANSGISSALPLATVSSPVGHTAVLLMPHIVSAGVDNLVIAAVDNMLAGIDSLVIAAINSVWAEMTPFTDMVRTGAASSCISCRTPRRPPGAPARMQ